MTLAVLADVHANLEALEAVLRDMEERKVERAVFLGDAVGYGPDPNACVEALAGRCEAMVAGNHDWAAVGLTSIAYFNPHARAAIRWTDEQLGEKSRKTLAELSLVRGMKGEDLLLVHGSPREPEAWHYLITPAQAATVMDLFPQRACLVGHSHMPYVFEAAADGGTTAYAEEAVFKRGARYVINAGSVGQPRDGDPRACYALLDEDGVRFIRVEYPVARTQEKMAEAGLPPLLIERLAHGR
jgi:predicted phosphodiesterase